jgi:scyllo-inositol 2-dehydrogenase (NADP+)
MNNTPIRTALCSFGMSGKVFHAPFVHVNKGFHLYGVWERSKKIAKDVYSEIKSFDSLEDMLADKNVELVIINTPNATHFEYAKKALLAAKHIIVEKPFVITSEEGEELIALAKQQQKKVSVYQNRRYDSDAKLLKKVVSENLLGEIGEAELHYDRFRKELSPKVHKETPGPGAGILYDLGPHLVDEALQLFGKPDAVFADNIILRPVSKVDDYFEILLYYPRKRVRLKASNQVKEPVPAFALHGSDGSLIKSRADVQENDLIAGKMPDSDNWGVEPENEKGLLHTEKDGNIIKEFIAAPRGNYMEYFDQMYRAIRFNDPVPVSAEEGVEVIKVLEAAVKSNKERRVVDYQ